MPNLVGIGNSQVPTNAMLGGLAYQDSVGEIDIEKIKAKTSDTAVDIFVYDTRKDSDGGAWRHRTQNTSWYNESVSEFRGNRKEFPAVAVIVSTTTQVTIYDGDDPNLPMWMVFLAGSNGFNNVRLLQYANQNGYHLAALNGILVIGEDTNGDNWGSPIINFISEYIVRMDPHSSEGGVYNGGVAQRNDTVGFHSPGKLIIINSQIHDVAMTVLPNAPIDESTGLPIPTIAVATHGGFSVIKDDGTVIDKGVSSTETNEVAWYKGQYLLGSGPEYWALYKDLSEESSGYISGTAELYSAGNQASWDKPQPTGQESQVIAVGDLIAGGSTTGYTGQQPGLSLKHPTSNLSNGSTNLLCEIRKDYNTGWMQGDIKGAFMSDTVTEKDKVNYALQATQYATGRLTAESYDDGDVSFHMQDDASSDNGYLAINFNGLTVGQAYKITMTRSAHATLDSGYYHRVDHNHGLLGNTVMTTWNNNTSSSHVVTGVFVAKTADDDDLVIYSNGAYIEISNFKVEETNDAVAKNLLSNGHFVNTSGWTGQNATLSTSGGKLRILTSGQGYAYATATTVPGKQYVLSLNLETDGNASMWMQIGSSGHGNSGTDLCNLNPLGEGVRWGASVMAKSTTTYISLKVSTSGSSKDIYVSDVVFEEAVRDHANSEYSNQSGGGLRVIGSVPKQVVNPGCELLSYGPFSNRNYFQCPNNRASYSTQNKFDDFGQNSMWGMAWINMNQYSAVNVICSGFTRSSGSNSGDQRWAFYVDTNGYLGLYQQSGSSSNHTSGRYMTLNTWNHVAFVRLSQNSGELHFFVNGVHIYNNSGVAASDLSNANMTINIGTDRGDTYPSDFATGGPFKDGKMSLLRIGRGELTVDIAKQIYEDEKQLFVENAKCSLYGSSDLVTAQAYDSTRDVLHLGTSAGRSDFVGLRRINNTTTAVTTAISASDGLIVEQ